MVDGAIAPRGAIFKGKSYLPPNADDFGVTQSVSRPQAKLGACKGDIGRKGLQKGPLKTHPEGASERAQLDEDQVRLQPAQQLTDSSEALGIAMVDPHKDESLRQIARLVPHGAPPKPYRKCPLHQLSDSLRPGLHGLRGLLQEPTQMIEYSSLK